MSVRTIQIVIILIASTLAACSAPAAAPASTATVSAPVQSPTQQSAPQASPTTASGGQTKIDLNEFFPPGPGRDLTLESCMGCHSVAPIIIARKTKGEWDNTGVEHRGNVSRLSDVDYKQIFEYLSANFYPGKPVPKLPPELMRGFTNY